MKTYLLLAICGVVGVFIRFYIHTRFQDFGWPLGTLIVNLIGCLAIGILYSWGSSAGLSGPTYIALSIGLLGALTTFSSFGLDTLKLIEQSRLLAAFGYVAISNIVGLGACYLGTKLGAFLHIS